MCFLRPVSRLYVIGTLSQVPPSSSFLPSTSTIWLTRGHRRRCDQIGKVGIAAKVAHGMVVGLAELKVARYGRQRDGAVRERLEVERIELFRHLVEGEFPSAGVAGMHEAFHGKVARVVAVLHIKEARAPDFARYIAVSVQRAGRHADHLIAEQAVLQEVIEHAGGELPAHGSAFEHQVHGHGFHPLPSRLRGDRGRGQVRLACAFGIGCALGLCRAGALGRAALFGKERVSLLRVLGFGCVLGVRRDGAFGGVMLFGGERFVHGCGLSRVLLQV